MTPASLDWAFLRRGMLAPAASMVVAMLTLGASFAYYDRENDRLDKLNVDQREIHDEFDELVYRRRILERYFQRYDGFKAMGFVGAESRLDWIETFRATATQLGLPSLGYSIEPQSLASRPPTLAAAPANVQVYLSKVRLEFGLVHEGDLLRFFDAVERQAPGIMKVDACELSRQRSIDVAFGTDTNINAECSLYVYSAITSDVVVGEESS